MVPDLVACQANGSVEDEVNVELHHVLQRLESPNTYIHNLVTDLGKTFSGTSTTFGP